jgi:RES domain-containing protein
MGLVKHEMHLSEARGWYSVEKFVCAQCIEGSFLKDLIESNAEHNMCDYCERQADVNIAATADILLEKLTDTLLYHFAKPVDAGVSYESREGGWQANVVSTEDALLRIGFGSSSEDLYDDVVEAITSDLWVEAPGGHWLGLFAHKEYMHNWEAFEYIVKHDSRYFFGTPRIAKTDPLSHEHLGDIKSDIFTQLDKLCDSLNLVRTIPSGNTFYRARSRQPDSSWPLDAANLGAPPEEYSSAGRMNPAGISYLYLADEEKTALAEVGVDARAECAVGTFVVARPLTVLNLAYLPEVPSIFDSERRKEREWNLFLQSFVNSITQSVEKDGREHIDYVPSQVISEYFRLVYEANPEGNNMPSGALDGILYPSVARPGHHNLVIFPVGHGYKRSFDQVNFASATVWPTAQQEPVRQS